MNDKQSFSDVSLKQRMASIPRGRCMECKKFKSYLNPLKKCAECKKKFCLDHIWGGMRKPDMKDTDEIRSVCELCVGKYEYTEI